MTANGTNYGRRTNDRYSARMQNNYRTAHNTPQANSRIPQDEEPVLYIYDRVCRKESKQRQLYKAYGVAAGTPRKDGKGRYSVARTAKKPRYKIVIENIINLFDSIDERRKKDVEAAKRNAIMKKKLLEHRRGFFLALFMIAFLTAFALLIYNLFFGIRSIYAEDTVNYTSEEVAAASGIDIGDKLYSFRADDVENRITFACPYIRSVEVTRGVPDRVSLALESDTAVYYADVYGEKLLLSEGLRVLGTYDAERNGTLTELYLPEISYSVTGRVITFADEKNDRFVRDILSAISASGLAGRISMADLRDAYDISMYCDGIYLLRFGGEKELEYKLKMAEKTIADSDFNQGTPAEINLNITGEASVRYDHNLKYTAGENE